MKAFVLLLVLCAIAVSFWYADYRRRRNTSDPVYHCRKYTDQGCPHVDGWLCDMEVCEQLQDYLDEEETKEPLYNLCMTADGGPTEVIGEQLTEQQALDQEVETEYFWSQHNPRSRIRVWKQKVNNNG